MADKTESIILAIFLASCLAYTVYAQSTVNCTATGTGRFADTNDTTCQNYTLCVLATNGTYYAYDYTCPTTSVFDPSISQCTDSSNYTCNSTTTTNTTDTCTGTGRYAYTTDTTCKSYYLCVLASNGTYIQYSYNCTGTSVFSPTSRVCTTSYTCTTSG